MQICFTHFTDSIFLPQVGPRTDEIAQNFELLSQRLENASSVAGLVVSLEKALEENGYNMIMGELNKKVVSIMGPSNPRLSLGYAILLYFTIKVRINVHTYICICSLVH